MRIKDRYPIKTPPRTAEKFLAWFIREDLKEEVQGDLLEKYLDHREKYSSRKANLLYWYQVLHYLRPFAIRNFYLPSPNLYYMFKNYLKITFRNLNKQRLHSLINILGLSISLTAVFLLLLWVNDEWQMDKFHTNSERLYRLKRTIPMAGNTLDVYRGVPFPLLQAAQEELPEVEKYITLGHSFDDNLQLDDHILRARGTFANAAYFQAFSFPILQGDINQLDKKIDAIAISEKLARQLFGESWKTLALGKTIHIHDNGDFTIEAIFADFPRRSSMRNDFLYSFQAHLRDNEWMQDWGNSGMQGVLLLQDEHIDPDLVAINLEKIFMSHQEGDQKEGCLLQKFEDDYLFGDFNKKAEVSGGRIEYVRLFLGAALLLLIISCINFVNLATARASKRAKEVGVRKTIGASKNSLVSQFITEAFLITIISVLMALIATRLLLPAASLISEKSLSIEYTTASFWFTILGITLITGLLAGAYPAFVLSSFRPINVLKGKIIEKTRDISFRKGLVIMQFTLSLLLIVGALAIRSQIKYIQQAHLGINKDNLLVVHQDAKVTEKFAVIEQKLLDNPAIKGVTLAGPSPLDMPASTSAVSWPKKRPDQANIEFCILWSAANFPDVFEIPMAAGRYYHGGEKSDTTQIVFNERAIEIMELEGDPIGQTIQWWGKPRQIIGVLQDFHNHSFYEKIEPAGFVLDPENAGNVYIKSADGQVPDAIAGLQSVFNSVIPDVPLHYDFVDEQYRQLYKSEMLTGKLTNYFAIISIVISCLGLFGLINFVAEQKTREIGIRKVLGASTGSLVTLLSRDFIRLVSIAFMVAIPLSYLFLDKWLERFAYQVNLNWWLIFAIAGFSAIALTLITISFKSIQTATHSPVDSLRME
ncbi:MAG: ABC transporter permease [Saprospiraceae bacterium]|nr:ABC transporter permease [Saprospiraceae bacterium]